jgi:small subunit ribosomal protein S16
VLALLKVKGEWQKFKGLPGAEGTYVDPVARTEDRSGFDQAKALNENEAKTLKAKRSAEPKKAAEPKAEEAKADEKAAEPKAEEAKVEEAKVEEPKVVEPKAEEVAADPAPEA